MTRGQVPRPGDQLLVAAIAQVSLDTPFQSLHVQPLQARNSLIAQQPRGDVRQRRGSP
jgi:hypothetical protein